MNLLLLSMLACFPEIQKEAAERFPENPTVDFDEDGLMSEGHSPVHRFWFALIP